MGGRKQLQRYRKVRVVWDRCRHRPSRGTCCCPTGRAEPPTPASPHLAVGTDAQAGADTNKRSAAWRLSIARRGRSPAPRRARSAHTDMGRGGQGGRLLGGTPEVAQTHAGHGGTRYEDDLGARQPATTDWGFVQRRQHRDTLDDTETKARVPAAGAQPSPKEQLTQRTSRVDRRAGLHQLWQEGVATGARGSRQSPGCAGRPAPAPRGTGPSQAGAGPCSSSGSGWGRGPRQAAHGGDRQALTPVPATRVSTAQMRPREGTDAQG